MVDAIGFLIVIIITIIITVIIQYLFKIVKQIEHSYSIPPKIFTSAEIADFERVS